MKHIPEKQKMEADDSAFMQRVYDSYHKLMFYIAKQYIPDQDQCQDIVQDCYFRLIRNIDRLRGLQEKELLGYIAATVRNTSVSHLRRSNRENKLFISLDAEIFEEPISLDLPPDEVLHSRDIGALVRDTLALMSEAERVLLEGRYTLGLTDEELAERLGCKPSSIRMKLTRARRTLTKTLQRKEVTNK